MVLTILLYCSLSRKIMTKLRRANSILTINMFLLAVVCISLNSIAIIFKLRILIDKVKFVGQPSYCRRNYLTENVF